MSDVQNVLSVSAELMGTLYLVTGRLFGEDDDTAYIVEAGPDEHPSEMFMARLLSDAGSEPYGTEDDLNEDLDPRVIVVTCNELGLELAHRIGGK